MELARLKNQGRFEFASLISSFGARSNYQDADTKNKKQNHIKINNKQKDLKNRRSANKERRRRPPNRRRPHPGNQTDRLASMNKNKEVVIDRENFHRPVGIIVLES
jgi:hypothetical protein